jgi:hypothetical protein
MNKTPQEIRATKVHVQRLLHAEPGDVFANYMREMEGAVKMGTQQPTFAPTKNVSEDGGFESWEIVVPRVGSGGQQRYVAPTLESLCAALGKAQWHATLVIRRYKTILDDMTGDVRSSDDHEGCGSSFA